MVYDCCHNLVFGLKAALLTAEHRNVNCMWNLNGLAVLDSHPIPKRVPGKLKKDKR